MLITLKNSLKKGLCYFLDTNFQQNNQYKLLIIILLSFIFLPTIAQEITKQDLEQDRNKYQRKIAEAIRLLETNEHNQKETLSKLEGINYQLGMRNILVENLQQEIASIDEQISDLEHSIQRRQKELEGIRKEYTDIIRAYNQKDKLWAKNVLALYFSSNSLQQFLSRKEYFKQYTQNRQRDMDNIHRMNEALKRQQQGLVKKKADKDKLLFEKVAQNKEMENDRMQYTFSVSKLKKDANYLQQDIANNRKAIANIDAAAIRVIKEQEAKKDKIVASTPEKNTLPTETMPERMKKEPVPIAVTKENEKTTKPDVNTSEEKKTITAFSTFDNAKGHLQLPVQQGFITRGFGTYQHPIYPKVLLENHGIDIRTEKDAEVRAVFNGEVVAVNKVPGAGLLVMVQHQKEYYTVYAKLKSISVKAGDKVSTKDKIGVVSLNTDGYSELQFQIWKGLTRLNPEDWMLQDLLPNR
jgi:septal ring factor EnvC (AmiA/AmiB activator)